MTPAARSLLLGARFVIGTVWAGVLVGFGALFLGAAGSPLHESLWFWISIASLAAGNWVFVIAVAERLCPLPGRGLTVGIELMLAAAMGISVIGAAASVLAGRGP